MKKTVCIIGGGASGIMAAIAAAKAGARVTILEHRDRIGKKILLTGNGKCNLTNLEMDASAYHTSGDSALIADVLASFDEKALMQLLQELGMRLTVNRDSYVYPETEAAATVVNVLRRALDAYGVSVHTQIEINEIQKPDRSSDIHSCFHILTNQGVYQADRVIFACGGKSLPKTGSDGSGWKLLRKLGIPMEKEYPVLTAFISNRSGLKAIAGIRANATVTLSVDNQVVASDYGQIQFTDYGISGIPVFQVSAYASKALMENKKVSASVNLFPDMKEETLVDALHKQLQQFGDFSFEEAMNGFLHKKWIDYMGSQLGLRRYQKAKDIPRKEICRLAKELMAMEFPVCDVKGYDFCQVTGGGVPLKQIDAYMQAKEIPGLYIVGEMLDVTGKCGGYNLQWAFSTGFIAGEHSAK